MMEGWDETNIVVGEVERSEGCKLQYLTRDPPKLVSCTQQLLEGTREEEGMREVSEVMAGEVEGGDEGKLGEVGL